MIRRLRKRFICITMLAVTAVLLLLCLIVNAANFVSVDGELTQMLETIASNQGTLPPVPRGEPPQERPGGQFTQETPFSTRYFVLRYTSNGTLTKADLDKIAAVTEEDTQKYLDLALAHGAGFLLQICIFIAIGLLAP